jgi:hypothetical protein
MSFSIKSAQRREIADKILAWLKEHEIGTCDKTYVCLRDCSESIGESLFDCWKGYDLLRIMGRVELNNPNGRRGFKVLSFSPLSLPISPAIPICDIKHCPILKKLVHQFPELREYKGEEND